MRLTVDDWSMKSLQPDPGAEMCMRTLGKLCEELGPDSVDEYILMFKSLWPSRVARLRDALSSNDRDMGEDAALSLCSSATMAGAYELAGLALQLQQAFREGTVGARTELVRSIEYSGKMVLRVLETPGFTERALRTYRESVSA